MGDHLPTEEQRKQLCELMHSAFIELRHLTGEQRMIWLTLFTICRWRFTDGALRVLQALVLVSGTIRRSIVRISESITSHCSIRFMRSDHALLLTRPCVQVGNSSPSRADALSWGSLDTSHA